MASLRAIPSIPFDTPTCALTCVQMPLLAAPTPAGAFPKTLDSIKRAAIRLALKRTLLRMARSNSDAGDEGDDTGQAVPKAGASQSNDADDAGDDDASDDDDEDDDNDDDDGASRGRLAGLEGGLKSIQRQLSAQGKAQGKALEKLTRQIFEIRAVQMTMQEAILRLADDVSPDMHPSTIGTPFRSPGGRAVALQMQAAALG